MGRISVISTDFGCGSGTRCPVGFTHKVYQECLNQGLNSGAAKLLTAHMALSTGWGKATHNFVLAGIKAGPRGVCYGTASPTYSGDYTCLCTFEYVWKDGKKVPADGCSDCSPKNNIPRCKHPFRAYRTLGEGVAAVIKLLKTSRYKQSWAYLTSGNSEYFAQLGRDGWYTAPVDETSASLKTYLAAVKSNLKKDPPVSSGPGLFFWVGAGGLLYWYGKKKGWF